MLAAAPEPNEMAAPAIAVLCESSIPGVSFEDDYTQPGGSVVGILPHTTWQTIMADVRRRCARLLLYLSNHR